ncbi:MAG TPA: beta-ketoacyl-ACP synthase II [Actinomycetota bacterium]|nr:beta-ketoacyl-ACP synthase II [Actinomycetota bacterium]
MSQRRKVVITGIGPVTPVGTGVDEFWQGLSTGQNGVRTINAFDTSDLPVSVAGYPADFVATDHLDAKEARRTDPFAQYAIASAKLAWADAGEPDVRSDRGAVIYATGIGGVQTLLNQHDVLREKGAGRVSPFMVPMLMANAAGGHIAMHFGLTGPNYCTVSACSSSNHAIGESMRLIRDGYSDLVIAGGSEAATIPLTVAAFAQMTALTKNPDPETASRPFDAERNGFVLSEGGCALIMESEEHATARGARIYCEVAGYGASDDAYHITAPDPKGSGAALAMTWALADAGEEPGAVTYVNAHGTSTPLNDAAETAAIKSVLGEHAHTVAVSSTKSMTGHMLGAAGAVEAAACALAIAKGLIPPTIHYRTPDPDCDLDITPNQARELEVTLALSNSFGFGGANATVAFRALA